MLFGTHILYLLFSKIIADLCNHLEIEKTLLQNINFKHMSLTYTMALIKLLIHYFINNLELIK